MITTSQQKEIRNENENDKYMKIICFSNQKGGCGKSSLLVLFAAYLKNRLNLNVSVIDADKQRTLFSFYQRECVKTENKPLYKVYSNSLAELREMLDKLDKEQNGILLIDTPNQLHEDNFFLLSHADHIIVPYNMSDSSILSTMTFLDVYKLLYEEDSKLIFVANAIKTSTKKEKIKDFKEYLSKDLKQAISLVSYFKDTVDIQKINSLSIDELLIKKMEDPLEELAISVGLIKIENERE